MNKKDLTSKCSYKAALREHDDLTFKETWRKMWNYLNANVELFSKGIEEYKKYVSQLPQDIRRVVVF